MQDIQEILDTWHLYPNYNFTRGFTGKPNLFVFKFSSSGSLTSKEVYSSAFWSIYEIYPEGFSKTVGFIFCAMNEVVRYTPKVIVSAKRGNDKPYIESLSKTKEWSSNGIDLIRYENAGELITDLLTVMGVDITVDLELNR